MTLPGFADDTAPIPSKTALGYLTYLSSLNYGGGWQFWSLAGAVGRSNATTEWVYLIRRGQVREACIDLATGSIKHWGGDLT